MTYIRGPSQGKMIWTKDQKKGLRSKKQERHECVNISATNNQPLVAGYSAPRKAGYYISPRKNEADA